MKVISHLVLNSLFNSHSYVPIRTPTPKAIFQLYQYVGFPKIKRANNNIINSTNNNTIL